jgi:hypothetical protein
VYLLARGRGDIDIKTQKKLDTCIASKRNKQAWMETGKTLMFSIRYARDQEKEVVRDTLKWRENTLNLLQPR